MENISTHFLNGKLMKEKDMVVSVRDLRFTRGYAVFDALITYPLQRPFMLARHIDRLFHSAELIGLSMPWNKEQVQKWVLETLEANKDSGEKLIKIIVSGGVSDSLLPSGNPTIAILIDPRHQPPPEWYENGVGVITVKHHRYIPEAKTNNYIEAVKQTQAAKKIDAVQPVYYDDTQVFEGSNSNIFAVIDGKLLTPETHLLQGITREVLLEILKLDIPIEVKNFTRNQLLQAQEAFLTGSNIEVTPVTKIDGESIGNGIVGEVTKEVMRQFKDYTLSNKW